MKPGWLVPKPTVSPHSSHSDAVWSDGIARVRGNLRAAGLIIDAIRPTAMDYIDAAAAAGTDTCEGCRATYQLLRRPDGGLLRFLDEAAARVEVPDISDTALLVARMGAPQEMIERMHPHATRQRRSIRDARVATQSLAVAGSAVAVSSPVAAVALSPLWLAALAPAVALVAPAAAWVRGRRVYDYTYSDAAAAVAAHAAGWVEIDLARAATPQEVALRDAVAAASEARQLDAYTSPLLDAQRAQLNLDEEVRQAAISTLRILRLETEVREARELLDQPAAVRALELQQSALDAASASLARRLGAIAAYRDDLVDLDHQLKQLEALTRIESRTSTMESVLAGIFADDEAARHLEGMAEEMRALALGVRDTITILGGRVDEITGGQR